MKSLSFSQKSVEDVKDPVIKGLISDITTIMQAELLQTLNDVRQKEPQTQSESSERAEALSENYKKLSAEDRTRLNKMARKLNTAAMRKNAGRLGIDMAKPVAASKQVNIEKTFGHLKGKEQAIAEKLSLIGRQSVVPFTALPDEEVEQLVNRVKQADPVNGTYADYLHLLPKDKLIELYERETGSIQNTEAFFAEHQPDAAEAEKIRRTVMEWQQRGARGAAGGGAVKYRNRYLKFIVTRVRCIDETEHEGVWPFEGEGVANDRIDLGAVNVNANLRTTNFGPEMVSDNFEDGRFVIWNREIARFDLSALSNPYPRDFNTTLTISEIDYGAGFAATLGEIGRYIRTGVVELVTKIGEMLGAMVGSAEAGKFIGKIVGELLALGLGELINIISRAVQDDVFRPQIASIRLDSPYSTFMGVIDKVPGPFRSPEQEFVFDGFGGSYRVYGVWELEREAEAGTPPVNPTGRTLRITTQTGGDDLRGYNTASFSINFTNGTASREYLLHRGVRAGERHVQNFELDENIGLLQVRGITIRHDGSPQWFDSYDNWNLDYFKAELLPNPSSAVTIHESSGMPLIRFTGDIRTFFARKQ